MLFNGRIHRNPKRYSNPYELAKAIDEYVAQVEASMYTYANKSENMIPVVKKPPSIAGLCLHLGFSSKKALLTLMARDNPTLRGVLETTFLWIESFYITQALQPNSPKAYETMLKAMGYSSESVETMKVSRTTSQTTSSDGKVDENVTFKVEFVRPKTQIDDETLKRQLLVDAGTDADAVAAIESQLRGPSEPKSIEATVLKQE